jgi:1-acyl-sn-glycerol-3-phosphate acyltransferase
MGPNTLLRKPLPFLSRGRSMLLRLLMVPNALLAEVEGEEHIGKAESAPCIFALNHNNAFESLFVPVLIMFMLGGRKVSFVIDWMFGKLPVIGWLMRQINPVYVYTKRSSLQIIERLRPDGMRRGILEQCAERLEAGVSVGIFPEGTRNRNPHRMLRAKPGIGHIALATGVPVIPVGISFVVAARRGKPPLAGRMRITFGEPMSFVAMSHEYRISMAAGFRREGVLLAGEAADEIMSAIAGLCGKRYDTSDRKSTRVTQPQQQQEELCPA